MNLFITEIGDNLVTARTIWNQKPVYQIEQRLENYMIIKYFVIISIFVKITLTDQLLLGSKFNYL